MQQSNSYILIYTAVLTVVCGLLLSVTSLKLKPFQDENKSLERKQNIVSCVIELKDGDDVKAIYDSRVKSYVVDFDGKKIEGKLAEEISVADEYKKAAEDRLLPVYELVSQSDPNKVEYYVLPIYGFGLWNNIWGYIALKEDLATIEGVRFDHLGETPGLGARIATAEIQARFKGKSIFDSDKIVPVAIQKGEGNSYDNEPHKVDGMSGATITGKGVNNMLADYLQCYQSFIKSKKNSALVIN